MGIFWIDCLNVSGLETGTIPMGLVNGLNNTKGVKGCVYQVLEEENNTGSRKSTSCAKINIAEAKTCENSTSYREIITN